MSSRRLSAARALAALGFDRAAALYRGRRRDCVTIFAYHRVLDVPTGPYASDVELVSAGVEQFRRQIEFVAGAFTPITFRTLLDCRDAGEPPPPGSAIVTFDDGFEDNYRNAFPVLRAAGVPATIFVSTGIVDDRSPFWFEAVVRTILSTRRPLPLPGGGTLVGDASAESRRQAVATALRALKRAPDAERRSMVDELIAAGGPDVAPADDHLPMTWSQIREMADAGIEFGSHTVSHPVLANVDDDALLAELRDSRERLEAETGRTVDVLAYPVGGRDAFQERVKQVARDCGYRAATSYLPGDNLVDRCDWFELRRVRVERYVDERAYRMMAALPGLFAV